MFTLLGLLLPLSLSVLLLPLPLPSLMVMVLRVVVDGSTIIVDDDGEMSRSSMAEVIVVPAKISWCVLTTCGGGAEWWWCGGGGPGSCDVLLVGMMLVHELCVLCVVCEQREIVKLSFAFVLVLVSNKISHRGGAV